MIAPITQNPPAGDVAGDQAEAFERGRRRRKRRRHLRNRRRRRARTLAKNLLLVEAGFRCQYCGADLLASVDAFLSITRDHLVARAHGGTGRRPNLIVCCSACDKLKGGDLVHDVAEARQTIEARREQQAAMLERLRELVGWEGP